MVFHFDTLQAATLHLKVNGWRELINGNWVSADGTCRASIHPVQNEIVAISVKEIKSAR